MDPGGANFTRLSKLVCAILAIFTAVTFFVPSSRDYLTLVPGRWELGVAYHVCNTHRSNQRSGILHVYSVHA